MDDELKKMLKPFKKIAPSKLQVNRWQRAVDREVKSIGKGRETSTWYALAAGLLIGFLSATFYFKAVPLMNQPLEILQANATEEWILTKTE